MELALFLLAASRLDFDKQVKKVSERLLDIARGLVRGELIPYLGPGALQGAIDPSTGAPIPADSDSLILAMNHGRPMAPRLMWEFPRAAMDVEL